MKQPVVYKLVEPITFGSEVYTELTIQPLKAKHLRKSSSKFDMADLISIAGDLTGLTKEEIGEMSAEDTLAVVEIVGGFLGRGPGTGKATTQR